MTEQLAPLCGRCRKRHLADLRCWKHVSPKLTPVVLQLKGTVCWLCGKAGADSADHVIPRARGGTDDLDNLMPSHAHPCNSRRRDGAPFDALVAALGRAAYVSVTATWRPSDDAPLTTLSYSTIDPDDEDDES